MGKGRRGWHLHLGRSSLGGGPRKARSGEFLRWTAGAELAFPNLDEGRLLTGYDEPEEVASALLENYRIVALKLGPAGAIVASRSAKTIRTQAVSAPIVDSTGAGDAFCAGFLASWAEGHDLERCARAAVTQDRASCRPGWCPPANRLRVSDIIGE